MEIELADIHTPPGNGRTPSGQRKFAKDEAVLARFGKQQQLRVSALPNTIGPSRLSFGSCSLPSLWVTESVRTSICRRSYHHLDDNLGGDNGVSHILVRPAPIDRKLRAANIELY